MEFIRNFNNLNRHDVTLAGGKGASLGEMTQAKIPVPPGFVILSASFDYFIEKTELTADIDSALHSVNHEEMHTVENASEKIKALILEEDIPKGIEKSIKEHFKKLNARFVAVRSSATSEDSSTAAWAGQLDSFLNTTEKTLLENVKKCWASLFTPRAIFYRFEKKLHKEKISVAVVVQKMVDSEQSGIAFSVHPVTQDRNQLIIEAGFGLGEAIVSGQITPDSYIVEKKGWLMLEKNISEQQKALVKSSKGGNEWIELGEKGKKQVLSDKEVIELAKLIVHIEDHYGFPVDVEFAREKGKFFIVQSRPITTLTNDKSDEKPAPKYTKSQKKSSDYTRMFSNENMPFLINSIFLEHYLLLDAIAFYTDNLWTTYLPKSVEKITLQEGLSLYKSSQLFNMFKKEFESYINSSRKYFESIIKKKKITKEEAQKYFNLISDQWKFYRKTEFFYVDKAFEHSKNDKVIASNLKDLGKLMIVGRTYLNKLIFGNKSYLNRLLIILGKQFRISELDLFLYSKEEIYDLFSGTKLSADQLRKREDAYVFLSENHKLINLEGEMAREFIAEFIVVPKSSKIKGISANPGKIKGFVKVIFYGPDKYDEVSKFMQAMKKGDILVTETTSPEIMPVCKKASAILTNQAGLMSHAAIISRELKIPCIVGFGNITHVLKDGDYVEVDADKGIIKILKKNIEQKIILSKLFTRQRTLFHFMMWDESDRLGFSKFLGHDLRNNLFLYKDGKTSVWHDLDEIAEINDKIKAKLAKDRKFVGLLARILNKNWRNIFPFASGKKQLKTVKELKDYYDSLVNWWSAMTIIYNMTEIKGLNKKLAEHAYNIRAKYEKYSTDVDKPLLEFWNKAYPKYKELAQVASKDEILKSLTASELIAIKKRMDGYALFNGQLINLKELNNTLEKNNIVLEKENVQDKYEINGVSAFAGKVKGIVKIILSKNDLGKLKKNDILVTDMTDPSYAPALKLIGGIVTDEGGITSHAAIISRELKIPCVIGTKNATQILKDNDFVEVDANQGIIRKINNESIQKIQSNLSMANQKNKIYDKNWVYLVNRPYILFGTSLYQAWFDSPMIYQLFGKSIQDNIYVEEHPNVVRRYEIKEQLDDFSDAIKKIITEDRVKAKAIILKGIKLSSQAKAYIKKSPFSDLKSAVEFLIELALYATVFSYFAYPIVKEKNDKELINLVEKLRANSYYPKIIEKIINPLAKKEAGEDFNYMLISEMFDKDRSKAALRKKESKSKRFIYAKVDGNEFVEYVDDTMALISRLEKVKIKDYVLGQTAYPGKVTGIAKLVFSSSDKIFNKGDILVSATTNPALMPIIRKCGAIVTDEGGITSHAAIISRELKKPCVIGTRFATHTFKDGNLVEVDADKGIVKILKKARFNK